jgi:serine/threonine protein kinase
LLAEIGRGGFGAVYKARDIHLDQFVAVKELILEDTSPLKDEAKVLSELRHRNIVGFRQLFPEQGRWYMIMDYVEGANLAKLISTRSLYAGGAECSLRRMLLIAHQAADGLHFAHDRGIIHQDVKPANVMVDSKGVARVSDFGLAKARQQGMNMGSLGGRDTIMISGKGFTPAYCSPEQATGNKLTRKTDTWSWGLCVLEMFAGKVTWTSGVLAREALAEYGAMQERQREIPSLPQRLSNLLARCFQEESQMRPDMGEIAACVAEIESARTGNWFKRLLK